MRNLNIINGLKDALSNNLLDLHFQPKIHLNSNTIAGAEALLRWSRGNPQLIMPDEFIPIIESTELIHDIGAWVIEESCKACREWHDAGYSIKVAANVSAGGRPAIFLLLQPLPLSRRLAAVWSPSYSRPVAEPQRQCPQAGPWSAAASGWAREFCPAL